MTYVKPSKRRWIIVATLFVAIICNYLDRQLLSILKPEIMDFFKIGNFEYAWIVNVFLICYAIMYPVAGILVDKFGPKKVLFVGITVWSLACIGGGCCSSDQVVLFAVCRGFLGISEPSIFSALIISVTVWFEKKERATPNAICQNGGMIGAIIAPIVIASLMGVLDSWQHVFWLAGFVGLGIAVVWLLVYKSPSPELLALTVGNSDKDFDEDNAFKFNFKDLLKRKSLWGGILIRFISDPVWYFCCFWLPGFLRAMGEAEGLSNDETLSMIQWIGALPYLAGAIGGFIFSYYSDRLIKKGMNPLKARKRILIIAACFAPIVILVPFISNSPIDFDLRIGLVIVIFCIVASYCQAWLLNAPLTVVEQFPVKNGASVMGMCCGAGAFGSVIFNQFVGSIPNSSWIVLFCIMGVLHIIATFVLLKMVGPETA